MKTEDLIAALGRETPAVAPRAAERRLAVAALLAVLGSTVLVLLLFGPREGLAAAPPAALLKSLFGLAMAAAAAPLVLAAARPSTRLGVAAAPLLALAVLSAVAAIVIALLAPEGARAALFADIVVPPCLKQVPIAAIPGGIVAFLAVRSLAPTRLAHAGAAAGAVAGALGVIAYAMHCPIDSPAYVLAWYPLGVALCAGAGALLGPRLLRW